MLLTAESELTYDNGGDEHGILRPAAEATASPKLAACC
jgi:hypothetical protein